MFIYDLLNVLVKTANTNGVKKTEHAEWMSATVESND
jgi:hypothetical protein